MYKPFFKVSLLTLAVFTFISCDKDFNEIGADIIGNGHFDVLLKSDVTLVANTVATGPVETKNLEINPLGVYDNPVFGTTIASFATQVELPDLVPTFDPELHPEVESVTLYVPYFSERKSTTSEGVGIYELDSIYNPTGNFNLKIYQSGYYLGDIGEGQQPQRYYSDQNADFNNVKVGSQLNNNFADPSQNTEFIFKTAEIENPTIVDGETTTTKSTPGMNIVLDKTVFQQKIINAPAGMLASGNVFKNYFRGLYFRADENSSTSGGALGMLNFKAGTITIKYKEDKIVCTVPTDPATCGNTRVDKSMILYLRGNTASLLDNDYEPEYAAGLAQTPGDNTRLFLKGGQGSVATIDLFGPDLTGHPGTGGPDGVPDELAALKALQEAEGATGWLINEANLSFYIDRDAMSTAPEPARIYLYDITNKRPIVDYSYDATTGTTAKKNKLVYGGIIEEEPGPNGRGIKYKIRLTSYIRNLVKNDSTNVRLGLSVTENIAITSMAKTKNTNAALNDYVPTASVMSPLGTILYGNHPSVDEEQRLRLEIFYTKPH